jgi:GNAT superfamily N-acetyltransferase
MMPRLLQLPAERYVPLVLPHTHAMWGATLPYDLYAARTLDLAKSAFGRTSFRTYVFAEDERQPLASFKWYERRARLQQRELRAMGIGAVFTPPEQRGRGYASAMLAMALDLARSEGIDFAFLFSDIHPQFYKTLGFAELPSRSISLRADSLMAGRLQTHAVSREHWSGLRTCFERMERARDFAFLRPAAFWNWTALRIERAQPPKGVQRVDLFVRSGRSVAAYVLGQREPAHDAYIVDEIAFSEKNAGAVAPLLRYAAGDLRRIAGWLPPSPVRALLPRGSVRRRPDAILMAAPLTPLGAEYTAAMAASGSADPLWKADHV